MYVDAAAGTLLQEIHIDPSRSTKKAGLFWLSTLARAAEIPLQGDGLTLTSLYETVSRLGLKLCSSDTAARLHLAYTIRVPSERTLVLSNPLVKGPEQLLFGIWIDYISDDEQWLMAVPANPLQSVADMLIALEI